MPSTAVTGATSTCLTDPPGIASLACKPLKTRIPAGTAQLTEVPPVDAELDEPESEDAPSLEPEPDADADPEPARVAAITRPEQANGAGPPVIVTVASVGWLSR